MKKMVKTWTKATLREQVNGMEPGDSFTVGTQTERVMALQCGADRAKKEKQFRLVTRAARGRGTGFAVFAV